MKKAILILSLVISSSSIKSMAEETLLSLEEKEYNNTHFLSPYYCHLCEKIFRSGAKKDFNLKFHLKNEHLICEFCSIKFETQESIDKHFNEKHNN